MLHRQRLAFLREVEHVENDGLGAAVHAVPALAGVNQFCGLHRRDFFHCKYFGAKLRCII